MKIRLFCIFLLASFHSHAQQFVSIAPSDRIGLIRGVYLAVQDDVSGGCWTNAISIENKTRIFLERNNIGVFDEQLLSNAYAGQLFIYAAGEAISNAYGKLGCVGRLSVTLSVYPTVEEFLPSVGKVKLVTVQTLWQGDWYLLSSPNLNTQIVQYVDSGLNSMLAEGLKNLRTNNIIKEVNDVYPGDDVLLPLSQAANRISEYNQVDEVEPIDTQLINDLQKF